MSNIETLAVIIPVWGEKELVKILYDRLINVLKTLPVEYKIIYVNDCCPFGSGEELNKILQTDKNVQVINFTRNFGEAVAVKAGIDNCDADWAVIMDCDLQDRPEDIIALYNKAKEGYSVVWGERVQRNDKAIKKFLSKMFYVVNNLISETKIDKKIGSFSIISKDVIAELKKINDYTFNYIQMVEYLGFKKAYVPIVKDERAMGKSGYNLIKGVSLALNIMISTSNKPLLIPIISSILMFLLCLLCIVVLIGCTIFDKNINNPLLYIFMTLILFLAGILFLNLSILGIYIGIILKETLSKPHYVIKKEISNK